MIKLSLIIVLKIDLFLFGCLFTCIGDFYKSVWIPIYGLFGDEILLGCC